MSRAPVLIFEILSPSTAKKGCVAKFRIYEEEGVLWYCIVDPENHVTKIYQRVSGRYIKQVDISNESYLFDLEKCQITLDFSKIWPE